MATAIPLAVALEVRLKTVRDMPSSATGRTPSRPSQPTPLRRDLDLGSKLTARCPNCGNGTALELVNAFVVWPTIRQDRRLREGSEVRINLWECTYCLKLSALRILFADSQP